MVGNTVCGLGVLKHCRVEVTRTVGDREKGDVTIKYGMAYLKMWIPEPSKPIKTNNTVDAYRYELGVMDSYYDIEGASECLQGYSNGDCVD